MVKEETKQKLTSRLGEVSLKDFLSTKANPCQDVLAKGFKYHKIV